MIPNYQCFEQNLIFTFRLTFSWNFPIGKEESKHFKYLGLNLSYQVDKITIDQKEYIKNLECVNIKHYLGHDLSEPLSNDMKDILGQKVGQLLWFCNQSTPDICFCIKY